MPIQTPDWVKDAVFYQIFPDRFARATQHSITPAMKVPLEAWDVPPTLQGYKGGDLWGIMEKLNYLEELGVTAIYLTPVFQSTSNHRYHTHDYYKIDPLLGGNEALDDLLEATHQRGMKLVLDGVFNHASRGFFFFNDILENGPHSPWLDWFMVESWPLSAYDGNMPANYVSWIGNRALPKFNHHNPEAREYIMQVGEYWIKAGIDGWRLDVPAEIQVPGFWQEFRNRVKAINPEAYIVGEVWDDASEWLDGTQFDGVMNYLFTGPTLAFTAGDRVVMRYVEEPHYYPYPALDAVSYAHKMKELLALYDWQIQLTQLNFLSTHDVARVFTVVGGEEDRPNAVPEARCSALLSLVLLLTFPGAPCIYYGDEVGVPGGIDPTNRHTFPAESKWERDVLDQYRTLIALRHRYAALKRGDYRVLYAEGMVYVMARVLGEQVVLVVVNAGDADAQVDCHLGVPAGDRLQETLFGEGQMKCTGDRAEIRIPGRSSLVVGTPV